MAYPVDWKDHVARVYEAWIFLRSGILVGHVRRADLSPQGGCLLRRPILTIAWKMFFVRYLGYVISALFDIYGVYDICNM